MTKNCVGSPQGCIETRDCKAALSITTQGDEYVVNMISHQSIYVAFGLSEDTKMVMEYLYSVLM